jgi:carbonic anhydrase
MFYRSYVYGFLACILLGTGSSCSHKNHDRELHTMPGLDHGLIQSPVNILTSDAAGSGSHTVEIHTDEEIKAADVVNTGHSVKLDFESGTSILFDGVIYYFLQAHFHTPSEHQLDGITYPMEIHFVSQAKKQEKKDVPDYLVVGAFFKMGKENDFIASFLDVIPEHSNDTALLSEKPVYINELLLPEEPFNDYYYYKGSLTTPPFTESVNWVVMKRIMEASPEQIQYINKLEGNNARHVHALFGRKIESN